MAVSKDDILETISSMTIMEVVDLISAMEKNSVYLQRQQSPQLLLAATLVAQLKLKKTSLMLY